MLSILDRCRSVGERAECGRLPAFDDNRWVMATDLNGCCCLLEVLRKSFLLLGRATIAERAIAKRHGLEGSSFPLRTCVRQVEAVIEQDVSRRFADVEGAVPVGPHFGV